MQHAELKSYFFKLQKTKIQIVENNSCLICLPSQDFSNSNIICASQKIDSKGTTELLFVCYSTTLLGCCRLCVWKRMP